MSDSEIVYSLSCELELVTLKNAIQIQIRSQTGNSFATFPLSPDGFGFESSGLMSLILVERGRNSHEIFAKYSNQNYVAYKISSDEYVFWDRFPDTYSTKKGVLWKKEINEEGTQLETVIAPHRDESSEENEDTEEDSEEKTNGNEDADDNVESPDEDTDEDTDEKT